MKLTYSLLLVVPLLLPLSSLEAKQPTPPSVKADNKDQFDQVAEHIREQMQPGGRFEFLDDRERTTVDKDLGDMQSLFAKSGSVNSMDSKSKIQLYNDQSEVNAILTRRDGDKEVCSFEVPTGSQIAKTTCRTYSDMERQRRDTLKMSTDMLQPPVPQANCLPGGASMRSQCGDH